MKIREKYLKIIGIIVILLIISNFIPTQYFLMSPGLAQSLSPIITVEEGNKETVGGKFMLTAVQSQRATIADYLYVKLFNPLGKELENVGKQLPPGMDMKKYIEIMAELMEESKLKAQAVAFEKAGYEVEVKGEGARVVEVLETGAAVGKLKKDDIIVGIDGKEVEFATEAVDLIRKHKIGERVNITILRGQEKKTFTLQTVEIENSPGKASIGVMITTKGLDYNFPYRVSFTTKNIVGPSAGSMFTLEIYNQIVRKDITGGKKIAGTGTISLDGSIGMIDGVVQKVLAAKKAGADIFLAPENNYQDAKKVGDGIEVVSVKNIEEALEYLKNHVN